MSAAGANNSVPLNVAGGDSVRASYSDALTSSGGAATVTADAAVVSTNQAPVVTMTGSALSFTEGNSATAVDAGLTVTDADSPNLASATVSITANFVTGEDVLAFTNQTGITGSFNATTGVLTLTGSATVANYQIALRSVTYANASTNPSTTARTVSVVANDGTVNSNTATRSITMAAVNDPPVVAMTASALAFTEGNSATPVDTGLTVTDADSPTLASATVSITANFVTGEDVLAFTNQNGITGTFNATTGVLTLTGSATVVNYQTALRSVTYANASTNPSTLARTVSVVANDGTVNSNTATRSITMAAVNDPPVVAMTASALAFTEGNSATPVDTGLTVTDADSPTLASATVSITANFVTGEDVLAFTNQNGITGTFNATTGVLTLTGSATVANYQIALRSVTYANASTNPSTLARTVSVVANDGTVNSNTATRSITIAAVNDPPVVAMTASALAFTEGNSATPIDTGLTVTDADSPNLASATVALTANFVTGEDVLGFTNQNGITGSFNATTGVLTLTGSATVANYQIALRSVTYANASTNPSSTARTVSVVANDGTANSNTATRTLTVAAVNDPPVVAMTASALAYNAGDGAVAVDPGLTVSDVDSVTLTGATISITANFKPAEDMLAFTAQNGITGSFNAATGAMTLTGSATVAQYQAALRSVLYANTAAPPDTATRTVSVVVTDGTATSNTATRGITVATAANQPPVVTMTASALMYAAGSGTVAADSGLTVADADSANLASATMKITANFVSGEDVLGFANQNGITGSFNATTGILTLTGSATVANYQTALRSVTYANTVANPSTATRTLSVVANDGTADSNTATRDIAVTPASSPTLDQPAAVTVDEDSAASSVTLTGIDAGASGGALAVAVQAADPSLFSAFSVSYADPGSTASILFTPAPDAFGSTDVAVTVTAGAAGSGRATTKTFRLTITPVNDRPILDAPPDHTATVGMPLTVSLAGIGTGAANETQVLTVTAVSSNPSIVPNPSVIYDTPAATGTLTITAGAAGSAVITVKVDDGQAVNASVTRTFTVTASARINTPPTITPIADISAIEGNSLPPVGFTIGDAETPAAGLTVTFRSVNGTLIPASGIAMTGTDAARGLTLMNAPNKIGAGLVVVTVSDGELSAATSFTAVVNPLWNYYLPDGWAGSGIRTDIRATNPNGSLAPVRLTFLKPAGEPQHQFFDIPALTRWSVRLSDVPSAGGGEVSTFIRSIDNLPLLVERTMTWDADAHAGSAETALESTNLQWYYAEGAQGAMRTNLIVANPNDADVSVTVTFFLESGAPVSRVYTVGPLARRTIAFQDVPALASRNFGMLVEATLPIATERTMYLDTPRERQGGTTSAGVPFPSTQWYFAEGSDWSIFQTYMLLMNPGTTAANVHIEYYTMTGAHFTTTHVVNPRARLTVDTLKEEPRLNGQHFWMSVASDQPIAAERSMYWDRGAASLAEGHNSHGVVEPLRHWSTGDARVGGPQQYSTFVLVGNPTAAVANLTVTIKRDAGADIVTTRQVAPFGRDTINVNTAVPALSNESFWLLIDSDVPILVERSQYWNPEGLRGSWSAGTNTFALPVVAPDYNGCTYTVGPTGFTAAPQGARLTVSVGTTSRCTFTAVPVSTWLRAVAGASGSGVSSVVIHVDPNTSSAARTGTITIAGRIVSVAQDAAPPSGIGNPVMALDAPIEGARVGSVFRVTGWATDLAAMDETAGVSRVDVWAYPNPGSNTPAIFLGGAEYGADRPDIAGIYGDRTRASGFSLAVKGLPAGVYQVVAFAYSTVTGSFNQARAATVTVAPDPRIMIDIPGAGPLTLPTTVAGWVLDAAADGGTGIDAVDVWVYPAGGGPPQFVGSAAYGGPRPDVAAFFGKASFTNSGYGLTLQNLAPGQYLLAVFARRLGAPAFEFVKTMTIEIVDLPGRFMALDTPAEHVVVGPSFTLAGWAVDLTSPTGSGVDVVHAWAYPVAGGAPIFLGAAKYGMARDDVAEYLGDRCRNSAFSLAVTSLAPGSYRIDVFAHSIAVGAFDLSRSRVVTVTGVPQ